MPHRIVIIEDDVDNREMLREFLLFAGHHVMTAESGQSGVLAAIAWNASLVICDIVLPDLSGLEIPSRLAGHGPRGIPCVALTGLTGKLEREASLRAGFVEHLTKPMQFDVLEAVLSACPLPSCPSLDSKPALDAT